MSEALDIWPTTCDEWVRWCECGKWLSKCCKTDIVWHAVGEGYPLCSWCYKEIKNASELIRRS